MMRQGTKPSRCTLIQSDPAGIFGRSKGQSEIGVLFLKKRRRKKTMMPPPPKKKKSLRGGGVTSDGKKLPWGLTFRF